MKVSLGTIEVDDDQRKAIRKDLGKSGHATRDDVKQYLGSVVEAALKNAGSGVVVAMSGAQTASGDPAPEGDTLPDLHAGPGPAGGSGGGGGGTAGGGTTPSTGNLGSAGTPGGTS